MAAALARADLTAVLWFAGAFEKLRALKPCVLEEMQGKTVIDKYSQREKEMSLIRSCTVPTSKVQPDGWNIRRTTDGTPYFTRFKPGNEPDPMYFQEEHSVSFKYPVRPFPVLAQNAMVRASRSVGRLYEPGRTFLQNPIVLIVEGIVRGWCATTNGLPRPMPVTQIWAAVSELQRSMTREGQAVLSEVDDLDDSIAEGKPSVLRKSTDLPGKLVWSRLVDADKDFSAGPLGNEYASSALLQKMWPETIDEHDLGEDSTVRETAIRALSKLLTVYIENEYGQYLLRGDVKIARSWHYSTRNADYDADEFQNVLEKISVLIGHANEIKASFQEKQAKQKRVALYPLTTTDLKKQAQRTGDANGAFKRRLGHLCVFKLGSTVTKKGKQSSKVHSDLGCLVFHDDPRKEEHAWDCSLGPDGHV